MISGLVVLLVIADHALMLPRSKIYISGTSHTTSVDQILQQLPGIKIVQHIRGTHLTSIGSGAVGCVYQQHPTIVVVFVGSGQSHCVSMHSSGTVLYPTGDMQLTMQDLRYLF
jgi:hypothetical protein